MKTDRGGNGDGTGRPAASTNVSKPIMMNALATAQLLGQER